MLIRLIVVIAGGIGLVAVQDHLPKWLMVLLLIAFFWLGDLGNSGWDDEEAVPEPVRSVLAMVWLGGASAVLFAGGVAGLAWGGDVARLAAAGIPLGLAGLGVLVVWIVARMLRD